MPSCHPRSTIAESKLAYLSEGLHFCVSPFPVSLASKTAPTYARLGVESILTHQPYCIMRSASSTSPCCYSKYATYPPSHGVVIAHSVTYAPEWPINFGINYHQRNPPSMIPPQRTSKLTSQRHTNDTEEREKRFIRLLVAYKETNARRICHDRLLDRFIKNHSTPSPGTESSGGGRPPEWHDDFINLQETDNLLERELRDTLFTFLQVTTW